jgi:hypothetical protein
MADARVADPLSEAEMVNGNTGRPVRSDARRNEDAVLEAAKHVFAASGIDARHLRSQGVRLDFAETPSHPDDSGTAAAGSRPPP